MLAAKHNHSNLSVASVTRVFPTTYRSNKHCQTMIRTAKLDMTCIIAALLLLAVFVRDVNSLCLSCLRDNLTDEQIEELVAMDFKRRLMEKLGLKKEPQNITLPPKEVIEGLGVSMLNDRAQYVEKKTKIDTVLLQPINAKSRVSNTTSLWVYQASYFDIKEYAVDAVKLWIHLDSSVHSFFVYEYKSLRRNLVFKGKHNNNSDSVWRKIKFLPNKEWRITPWKKLRIEIEGVGAPTQKPLLQLLTRPKETHLLKRSLRLARNASPTISDCGPHGRCCKQSMILALQKYLPWIMYPINYQSLQCAGSCPLLYRSNRLWTFLSQKEAKRTPCCVPTHFTAVSIVMSDESGAVKKIDVPDLKVVSCGCL